ncbi:hypothetical protein [Streptomyces sp. NPDC000888]
MAHREVTTTAALRAPLRRRRILGFAGAGLAGLAASAGPATAVPVRDSTRSEEGTGIWVALQGGAVDSTGLTAVKATVGNSGLEATPGDVSVILLAPFWTRFEEGALPPEFVRHIVSHPDPDVPHVIECRVPASALPSVSTSTFKARLRVLPGGPKILDSLSMIALAPERSGDDPANNTATAGVFQSIGPASTTPRGANKVGLYYTYTQPVLLSGTAVPLHLRFGNKGPNAPKTDPRFTFVTPYNVKIDRTDKAFKALRPVYHHSLTDPRIPDVVSLRIPARSLRPDPHLHTDPRHTPGLVVPLIAYDGALPHRVGKAALTIGGEPDRETNLAAAIGEISVVQP